MSNILVTGGAGYIGSHVCKRLAAVGHRPVTFDNLSTGFAWAVKWGPLEEGDLLDGRRVEAVLRAHGIDRIIHFAAWSQVGESVARPGDYYRNNVVGTLSLLEAARRAGVSGIVFSSTAAVYGTPSANPIPETAPLAPINPYGVTKTTLERALADYHAAYGLRSVSLRYFNAAGADAEAEIGEAHDPETHLIPLVLRAMTDPGKPIRVFGDDYPTPDGTCIRDYIHVEDLADAHVRALDVLDTRDAALRFNLGVGHGYSVREVIRSVERVVGRPVPTIAAPRRAGDPAELVADAALAGRDLGWTPTRSDIDSIVATAWAWHLRNA